MDATLTRLTSIVASISLTATLTNCGGGSGAPGKPISAAIGPSGGSLTAAEGAAKGSSVVIPTGALDSSVTITLAPSEPATGLPASIVAAGPAIVLGPEGQTFSVPVTVTVPATGAATGMYSRPVTGGTWSPVAGASYDASRSVVVAQTTHFSMFVAVRSASAGGDGGGSSRLHVTVGGGARVLGVFHFAQDPQGLCLGLERVSIPTRPGEIFDIDCPGQCDYDLPPDGRVHGCLRAVPPGGGEFTGTWSGDCTLRIYPDVPWPSYAILEANGVRDYTCNAGP